MTIVASNTPAAKPETAETRQIVLKESVQSGASSPSRIFRAQGQGRPRDLSWPSTALIMKPEVVFGTVSAFPFLRQIR
jgi:hypothetical protein